jgi:salicylate hydroxylase
VLAKSLGEGPIETAAQLAAALARYARLRRSRVARMQRAARSQGRIYHLGGPFALARDLAIRALGPQRVLARQNWIYDWQA